MAAIDFNDDPGMDVAQLQAELSRIVDQLNNTFGPDVTARVPGGATRAALASAVELFNTTDLVVKTGVAIAATSTAVAHGLGFTPRGAFIVPYTNVAWFRSAAADGYNVYFQGAAPVTADVVIIP